MWLIDQLSYIYIFRIVTGLESFNIICFISESSNCILGSQHFLRQIRLIKTSNRSFMLTFSPFTSFWVSTSNINFSGKFLFSWHFVHFTPGRPNSLDEAFSFFSSNLNVFSMKIGISPAFFVQLHPRRDLYWFNWEANSISFRLFGPLVLWLFNLMHELLIWQKKQLSVELFSAHTLWYQRCSQ